MHQRSSCAARRLHWTTTHVPTLTVSSEPLLKSTLHALEGRVRVAIGLLQQERTVL